MAFLRVLVFRLNLCCVVQRNPTSTAFEPSPACRGAFAGELPGLGIVGPRAFTDVQIRNADLYKERNLDSCCFRCVDVYTVYIKHTISRIGISALLGVGEDLVCAFLRPGLASAHFLALERILYAPFCDLLSDQVLRTR